MAATLEIKYFNSFWLKKMKTVTEVVNTTGVVEDEGLIGADFITLTEANPKINVGQKIAWSSGVNAKTNFVYSVDGVTIYLTTPLDDILTALTTLTFGPLSDFTYIPAAYAEAEEENEDWHIEEARIRGGYNNTTVDFGVKAYIVDDVVKQQHLANSMIYSGIFNSRTGTNRTNEFSVGVDITKAVDPANGSIQKLFAEDTNLLIFQEGKVSQALIDKNAIYSAEGSPITTSSAQVIGQIQAYGGNYGISSNPESFATYGYRKYFTDRTKNAVLRLSQDGITEISSYGMLDYFRDNLSGIGNSGFVVGGWDMHNKQYILSMQFPSRGRYETLAFDEDTKGWVSRYTYKPDVVKSLRNETFTFNKGNLWRHYVSSEYKGSFYGTVYNSNIVFVFNPEVSGCKTFNTINYEGTNGWQVASLITDTDRAVNIAYSNQVNTLANLETQIAINNFKKKENKYFANIVNNTAAGAGDVIFGQSISGIKGYYATVSMLMNNNVFGTPNSRAELFAVSLGYVESSY
jgi:hypothetical protein